MEKKIKLKTLNPFISCKICRGYLIDATTIVECLHTCKYIKEFQYNFFFVYYGALFSFSSLDFCLKICFVLYANVIKLLVFISVCKSCLVKHLEESPNNACPDCNLIIHQSHPLQYISHDRTMQDIVYKLVPDLQDSK